jgi:hypothetical protein
VHAPGGDVAPDDSLLEGDGIDVHPLSKLAASTLTSSDLWTLGSSEADDSRDDGSVPVPRPEGTRIRLERGPGSLSVAYGLRRVSGSCSPSHSAARCWPRALRAAGTLRLMNPTASPMLTEAEAAWVASEMKRTLGQA